MFSRAELAYKFLRYWLTASNGRGHGIHSPFVFDFVIHVLRGQIADKTGFRNIEIVREKLKKSDEKIQVSDLGAGSVKVDGEYRKLSSIAKYAAKPSRFAQLLYRVVRYFQIDQVLELGTSLGLTTRYLALAKPSNGVITIEGAPAIAKKSEAMFFAEGFGNIEVRCGDFGKVLPVILPQMQGRKLIFFDGNHRYSPTMDYFKQACAYAGEEDIFVFDDIHWSKEMELAWKEIKKNKEVTCTVDLFFIGLVFFRKDFKEKQEFAIRF
jgi:predicted O-methyltransferase YrrM